MRVLSQEDERRASAGGGFDASVGQWLHHFMKAVNAAAVANVADDRRRWRIILSLRFLGERCPECEKKCGSSNDGFHKASSPKTSGGAASMFQPALNYGC